MYIHIYSLLLDTWMTETKCACWQDDVCCGNSLHNSRTEVLVTKVQIAKSYQQAKKKILALKIQGLLLLYDFWSNEV